MGTGIEKACTHCIEGNCAFDYIGLHEKRANNTEYTPPGKEEPKHVDANRRPHLKADGTDFHDPCWSTKEYMFDKTCMVCGYHGSWGSPHRLRPDGNHERLDHGTLVLMIRREPPPDV